MVHDVIQNRALINGGIIAKNGDAARPESPDGSHTRNGHRPETLSISKPFISSSGLRKRAWGLCDLNMGA